MIEHKQFISKALPRVMKDAERWADAMGSAQGFADVDPWLDGMGRLFDALGSAQGFADVDPWPPGWTAWKEV